MPTSSSSDLEARRKPLTNHVVAAGVEPGVVAHAYPHLNLGGLVSVVGILERGMPVLPCSPALYPDVRGAAHRICQIALHHGIKQHWRYCSPSPGNIPYGAIGGSGPLAARIIIEQFAFTGDDQMIDDGDAVGIDSAGSSGATPRQAGRARTCHRRALGQRVSSGPAHWPKQPGRAEADDRPATTGNVAGSGWNRRWPRAGSQGVRAPCQLPGSEPVRQADGLSARHPAASGTALVLWIGR